MTALERIKDEVATLAEQDVRALTDWLNERYRESWDRQFEADVLACELDDLADKVLADHRAGQSTPL